MVLIFKSQKALNFLLENGEVYTLRPKIRKEGRDWITNKRGGRKIADAEVKLIGVCATTNRRLVVEIDTGSIKSLEDYVEKSGFSSVEEWFAEGNKIYKGKIPNRLYLYYVKLTNSNQTSPFRDKEVNTSSKSCRG